MDGADKIRLILPNDLPSDEWRVYSLEVKFLKTLKFYTCILIDSRKMLVDSEEMKPKIVSGGCTLQKNLLRWFSRLNKKRRKFHKVAIEILSFLNTCLKIHKKFLNIDFDVEYFSKLQKLPYFNKRFWKNARSFRRYAGESNFSTSNSTKKSF